MTVDITTSSGKLIIGVPAAVTEFARSLIIERILECLARAESKGKRLGHPPGSKDKWSGIRELEGPGKSVTRIFPEQLV